MCIVEHVQGPAEPQPAHGDSLSAGPKAKPRKQRPCDHFTRTYTIANTCRAKLGAEAHRADHDMARLVLLANMLDSLMDELVEAKREQYLQASAHLRESISSGQPRNVQWIDKLVQGLKDEADHKSERASNDGDRLDGNRIDQDVIRKPIQAMSPPPKPAFDYFDDIDELSDGEPESDEDDDEMLDDRVEGDELDLRRWSSKHCPPDMQLNDGSGSENEAEGQGIATLVMNLPTPTTNTHVKSSPIDVAVGSLAPTVAAVA